MLRTRSETVVGRMKHVRMRGVIIAALVLILLAGVILIPSLIAHLSIERQEPPQVERTGLSMSMGEIDRHAGNILLASDEGRELYIDTATLNIRVVDTATRTQWNSSLPEGGPVEKSPITVRYLGKDSAMYEWDAYTYSIQNGRYTLHRIEKGVQIVLDLYETESYRLNEYMPARISVESYQRNFLDKLEEKVTSGEMSAEQADRYRETLAITYQLDIDNDLYYNKFAGLPPLSLVRELIAFAKAVDYTTEMLVEDSQQFGISTTVTEPARFVVTMEVTLDQGDLVVRVPTYEIKSGNDFYTVQNISVLPSFGLASAERIEDGYIFVPDGAGALFKMNTFNGKYPEYERPIYNNNYYSTLYELPEFPENLTMPVFGMYMTDRTGRSRGHMGVIEEGAELGYIKVQLGTEDTSGGGTPYNKVYSTFDSMQYSRVKVFGPYSDNDARFLSSTGLIEVDYTVRYKLFGEKIAYYDMAEAYKEYLINRHGLEPVYESSDLEAKLFLEVLGTVTLEKRFLGIPYKVNYAMTTFRQLREIVEDLQDANVVVNVKGVFNNGLKHTIMNNARLTDAGGSKKEFMELMDAFDGDRRTLFLSADLMSVADTSGGFRPRAHALHGYDGKPLALMNYDYSTGRFDMYSTKRYLLHPLVLDGIVDQFIKRSAAYPNIAVNDIGSTYYANYDPGDIVDPIVSAQIVEGSLQQLAEHKTLALDNPTMNKIRYSQYAVNISRESSLYGTMYSSIPFRQLVMNGLTEYTTLNVNMSAERSEYYLLQALELGSIPKFTISAESADVLKNTEYSDYFSIQYALLQEEIKAVYEAYSEALSMIGSKEITDHRMLDLNVFRTTYASGTSVIVNYNKYPVSVLGYELDALGYILESEH